ncbi:retrovirus-related pol polyprotein from transposon TNT 1-94 [Tanacetum coccineum]
MYKARLVVKGFQQIHRVDYNEIFSLVVKMTTIRLVLSIVASEDLHLEKLDVNTTFLHGDHDEDIYMTQQEGFQSAGKEENLVCKLKKSLYRLKQAPRQWYLKFDSFMQRVGNKRCALDHYFYLKKVDSSSIIILIDALRSSWAKLVRILISEGSLSLLKILGGWCLTRERLMMLVQDALYRKSQVIEMLECSIVKGKVVRSLHRLLETESSEVISLQMGEC